MDSTIIDGTGLANYTVEFQSDGHIQLFTIKGKGEGIAATRCIRANQKNIFVDYCRILNADRGIGVVFSSTNVNQCIITNVKSGFGTYGSNTSNSIIKNSIISTIQHPDAEGIHIEGGGNTAEDNIVLAHPNGGSSGIEVAIDATTHVVKSNIVSGFSYGMEEYLADVDTAIIHNNISYKNATGYFIRTTTDLRNNIAAYNTGVGVNGPTATNSDYNLYWKNSTHTTGGLAEHDIVADPMFINDTIPAYGGSYDYHLQMFSPAIDSGDPNILDVDGSRSDIGVFGGPGGEMYTYQDLAPKPPANLTAVYDSGLVKLTWDKNTEADLFRYRVYRDTVPNFIYDTTKIIAVTADTFYFDDVPEKYLAGNYYYKVTAIDSAYNQSAASEEVHIIITGAPEGPPIVVQEYKLLHNYPNPFNPSTKIPYRLKDGGYVKLMVYDIKGELLKVLVNEYQNAGYYEIEFSPNESEKERGKLDSPFETGYRGDIASGIYLYRIEVIGDGKIPRFSEMKKMIYVK